jgi:hypothetical protein
MTQIKHKPLHRRRKETQTEYRYYLDMVLYTDDINKT